MDDIYAPFNFQFKSGPYKEKISMSNWSQLNLLFLLNRAATFIRDKFPDQEYGDRLSDHLLLYRHDFKSVNILQPVNNTEELVENCLIEVVISPKPLNERIIVYPHTLLVHSYRTPTFCDFCGEILLGLFKQGLQCQACRLNCHKRCAMKVPNNCKAIKSPRNSSVITFDCGDGFRYPIHKLYMTLLFKLLDVREAESLESVVYGCLLSNGGISLGEALCTSTPTQSQQHPMRSVRSSVHLNAPSITITTPPDVHNSSEKLLLTPCKPHRERSCSWSGRPLWMELSEATQMKLHTYKVPTVCQVCRKLLKGIIRQGYQCKVDDLLESGVGSFASSTGGNFSVFSPGAPTRKTGGVRVQKTDSTATPPQKLGTNMMSSMRTDGGEESVILSPMNSSFLMSSESVILSDSDFEEINKGTASIHYKRTHFWRLDHEYLTMHYDDRTKHYFKKIPLSDICQVKMAADNTDSCSDYKLEILTNSSIFYVGRAKADLGKIGGMEVLNEWQEAIQLALMPIGRISLQDPDKKDDSATIKMSHLGGEIQYEEEFGRLYQIKRDEELGAGCFGNVYTGVRRYDQKEVAVKVINKRNFAKDKEEALRTEVNILKELRHPGIVSFEFMLESEKRIFLVMEKLEGGDLLELIIHSESRKLNERTTKFITYQVLVALMYLHDRDIAHCDMKPENVLLSSDSDFPQAKLCDFGYAKIIGEKGFRHSLVGTMAYLAPEVLRHKKFNRSLDMWSVGVVVYVCLSGTFPFDDQEDLVEQIKQWEKGDNIFHEKRWKQITDLAKDFITGLLEVSVSRRWSVDRALTHKWLQTYSLWSDLRCLEESVGQRYLTRSSDDEEWHQYEKIYRIQTARVDRTY